MRRTASCLCSRGIESCTASGVKFLYTSKLVTEDQDFRCMGVRPCGFTAFFQLFSRWLWGLWAYLTCLLSTPGSSSCVKVVGSEMCCIICVWYFSLHCKCFWGAQEFWLPKISIKLNAWLSPGAGKYLAVSWRLKILGLINGEQSVPTCICLCFLILPISISLGLFLIIFLSVAQNSKTHIRLLMILILHTSLAHYISSDNRGLL